MSRSKEADAACVGPRLVLARTRKFALLLVVERFFLAALPHVPPAHDDGASHRPAHVAVMAWRR